MCVDIKEGHMGGGCVRVVTVKVFKEKEKGIMTMGP